MRALVLQSLCRKTEPAIWVENHWQEVYCDRSPGGSMVKICLQCCWRQGSNPWVKKIPLEKGMATLSRRLADYSPWDWTQLATHTHTNTAVRKGRGSALGCVYCVSKLKLWVCGIVEII